MVNPAVALNQGRGVLLQPFARVTLKSEKGSWVWGDGLLKSVSVTLSEGETASTCSLSLYDKDRKITDRMLTYVEAARGLTGIETQTQLNRTNTGDREHPKCANLNWMA